MLNAYQRSGRELVPANPTDALWVDLFQPTEDEVAIIASLGISVPSLADMEEIELSNRLYRDEGMEVLTVVLPGSSDDGQRVTAPVTFILSPKRLVSVRYQQSRPFTTYPPHAGQSPAGLSSPARIFLGVVQEIVARVADMLEAAGRVLDETGRKIFSAEASRDAEDLQAILLRVGLQGEVINQVRLALVSLERALTFFAAEQEDEANQAIVNGILRDINALSEHCDFLSSRIGLSVDAILGMISLVENATVRIFSVLAVIFLPPTLIASIYGMNFRVMPELTQPWGYPAALGLMVLSAIGSYLFFKWKRWL